jgi:hypothetical protein
VIGEDVALSAGFAVAVRVDVVALGLTSLCGGVRVEGDMAGVGGRAV